MRCDQSNILLGKSTVSKNPRVPRGQVPIKAGHSPWRSGFTIVEILVVVTIIGILATAVVINVTGYIGESRQERARMDIASIKNAVELYYLRHHRYPNNDEGLESLTRPTPSHPTGILSELPRDPWGRPYEYRHPGQHGPFDILSYGRDGAPGGEGEDADIGSWQLGRPEAHR